MPQPASSPPPLPSPPALPALDPPLALLLATHGGPHACAAALERAGFAVRLCASPEEARALAPGAALCDAALLEEGDLNRHSMEQLVRLRLTSLLDRLGKEPIGLHALVMGEVERGLVGLILERCKGHRGQAAELLGLHRNTLRLRVHELGLESRPKARPRKRRAGGSRGALLSAAPRPRGKKR